MFGEIHESKGEKITDTSVKQTRDEGFKQIKPQTGMTAEEARKFMDELFSSMRKKSEG